MRLLKKMPFPIGIGIARLKTPYREATMPPRLRKLCLHPWRGWPGTMSRWSMRMETCMLHASWMDWTPCMGCPWPSSHSMQPCAACSRNQWNLPVPTTTCMAQITVILRERHGNRYRPGELARMSKDCFYAGLFPKNQPYGGSLEGPAPHHPFGPIEGAVGAGGEWCLDMYMVPTVHLCQIDTPHRSWRSVITDSRPLTKGTMGTRSALPNWMPPQLRWCPRSTPHLLGDTVDALKTWYNDGFLIGLRQAAEISKHRSGRCFNCQKEGHHWRQCKEILSPELQELSDRQDREQEERKKKALNPRGGMGMKGGHAPTPLAGISPGAAPGAWCSCPVDEESAGASPYKYWNEDALSRWLGMENLGWAILDGICTQVLVDNGARVNSVMPAYVRQHNLGMRPISELDHSLNPYGDHIPLVGLGGGQAEPLGFTLMRVQIEGMPHYDEHQVLFCSGRPQCILR